MLEKGIKEMKKEEESIKKRAFRLPVSDLAMAGVVAGPPTDFNFFF